MGIRVRSRKQSCLTPLLFKAGESAFNATRQHRDDGQGHDWLVNFTDQTTDDKVWRKNAQGACYLVNQPPSPAGGGRKQFLIKTASVSLRLSYSSAIVRDGADPSDTWFSNPSERQCHSQQHILCRSDETSLASS